MSWFHRIAREGTIAAIASVTMLAVSSVSMSALADGGTRTGGDGHGGSPAGTPATGTYVPTTPGGKSADGGYQSPDSHFLDFAGRLGGWLFGRDLGGNGQYVNMTSSQRLTSGIVGGLGVVGGGLLLAGVITGTITAAPILLGAVGVGAAIFGVHYLFKSFWGKTIDNRYQPQQPPPNHSPLPGTIGGPAAPGQPGSSIPGGNPAVPPYGAPQGPGSGNGSGTVPPGGSGNGTGGNPPAPPSGGGVSIAGTHRTTHGGGILLSSHSAPFGGDSGSNVSRNSNTTGATIAIPGGASGRPNEGFHH